MLVAVLPQMEPVDAALDTSSMARFGPNYESDEDTNDTSLLSTQAKPSSHASSVDEHGDIPGLDPRRFTPSLHANLVSEILSLRGEIDNKNKLVLGLEEQLSGAERENDQLNQQVQNLTNESRHLKENLQSIEGGSESAISSIAEERDLALGVVDGLKRRLSAVQKRLKSREDEVERVNLLWSSDKDQWENQRRALNRRIHATDSRVKILTEGLELAYQGQAFGCEGGGDSNGHTADGGASADDRIENFNGHSSHNNPGVGIIYNDLPLIRSGCSSRNDSLLEEHSLAVELGGQLELVADDGESFGEARRSEDTAQSRPISIQSSRNIAEDMKSHDSNATEMLAFADRYEELPGPDLSDQPCSCESTVFCICKRPCADILSQCASNPLGRENPHANKSTAKDRIVSEDASADLFSTQRPADGVDRSRTTAAKHVSNPDNDTSMRTWLCPVCQSRLSSSSMRTASTQTVHYFHKRTQSDSFHFSQITAGDSPPHTSSKDHHEGAHASLLAKPKSPVSANHAYQTASTQTESNSVIKRESNFLSSEVGGIGQMIAPGLDNIVGEQRHPPVELLGSDLVSQQNVSANVESLKLSACPESKTYSTEIITEKMLSFEDKENDILADLTDDSKMSREPVKKVLARTPNGWKSLKPPIVDDQLNMHTRESPQEGSVDDSVTFRKPSAPTSTERGPPSFAASKNHLHSAPRTASFYESDRSIANPYHTSIDGSAQAESSMRPGAISRGPSDLSSHQSAMISGVAIIPGQLPTDTDVLAISKTNDSTLSPPFPVPDRSSSKKLPYDCDSPGLTEDRVAFYGLSHNFRNRKRTRRPTKTDRSASVANSSLSQDASFVSLESTSNCDSDVLSRQRQVSYDLVEGTSSSPFTGQASSVPHGSGQISTTRFQQAHSQRSSKVTSKQASINSESCSVVDAIAQTMVGEWMWKYVRRRKSFGLYESPTAEFERSKGGDPSVARHRRWIWLAPYERAVMWSSKQPTSSPALMGKNGRKLVVQSVLDVRDEAPLPKGANESNSFGRSILVLTAQRALKFTAFDRERHIVWLTALSFLCHSSVLPQAPPLVPPVPSLRASSSPASERLSDRSVPSATPHHKRNSGPFAREREMPKPSSKYLATITEPREASTEMPLNNSYVGGWSKKSSLNEVESENDAAEAPLVPRFATRSRKKDKNLSLSGSGRQSFKKISSDRALVHKTSMQNMCSGKSGIHLDDYADGWKTDGETTRYFVNGTRQNAEASARSSSLQGGYDKENVLAGNNSFAILSRDKEDSFSQNYFEAIGTLRMQAFVDGLGGKRESRVGKDTAGLTTTLARGSML